MTCHNQSYESELKCHSTSLIISTAVQVHQRALRDAHLYLLSKLLHQPQIPPISRLQLSLCTLPMLPLLRATLPADISLERKLNTSTEAVEGLGLYLPMRCTNRDQDTLLSNGHDT